MMKTPPIELTVILPCYNEEENVKRIPSELIEELNALNLRYEIVAVDDGSRDNTLQELRKLQNTHANIKVFSHDKNMGLGKAIRTGIENSSGELIVTIDADFTFHPRQIRNLLNRFYRGDADCVIGSPKLMGYEEDVPRYRIALSNCGRIIYNIVLGTKITGVTPIFRLYRTEYLKELVLEIEGFGINAEILAKLLFRKRRIVEIPAKLTTRIHGVSSLKTLKEIKAQLFLAVRILKWRIAGLLK